MADDNLDSLNSMPGDSGEDLNGENIQPPGDITNTDEGTSLEPQLETKLASGPSESKNLDMILDIPLVVTVELGRTKMMINDLLQLGQGSVIELSKLVGEPLEILVNDKLVARGEVVVVNEKFGVRLTDIVSPMERIESLGN